MEFSRPEYWSRKPFPSPGDLPNPGIKPRSSALQILYKLSHKGSPRILEWIACPLSRGSSQPRNWTRVSCIAGGFFTSALPGYSHLKPICWAFERDEWKNKTGRRPWETYKIMTNTSLWEFWGMLIIICLSFPSPPSVWFKEEISGVSVKISRRNWVRKTAYSHRSHWKDWLPPRVTR